MNALTDKYPTKIKIKDKIYKINPDFRNCIRIIQAFEDDELSLEEQAYILIKRLYIDKVPEENIESAYIKGIKFLDLGKEQTNEEDSQKRVFSFSKDSNYIYTGINQSHRVDLSEIEYMHWWKFVYMFMDMGQECMFNQLIYYRKRKNEGKLTKEEKQVYFSMRKVFDLDYKNEMTEEENEFMQKLGGV